jgi:hypothetical protein
MRPCSTPEPMARRRVRAPAAVLLFVSVGIGAWVMWPRPAPPEPRPVHRQHAALPDAPRASARRLESATAPATSVISPPVIDAVIVEKPELCEGEETLVSVVAHTTNDSDAELHFTIGPGSGRSVPLRARLDAHGNPVRYEVTAFGKGNAMASAPVPPFRILPCKETQRALLSHRVMPNRSSSFEFRVQLSDSGDPETRDDAPGRPSSSAASRFEPRRYVWSFGDGEPLETTSSAVVHNFEDRPQDSLYTQALVRVDVVGRDGRVLVARDALQLLNPAYESLSRKGIVSLMTALDPPFPHIDPDGRVRQHVRLWHHRREPVRIESVRRVSYYAESTREPAAEDVDAAAVLGTAEIAPDHGLELDVTLDTETDPDVISRNYYLEGKSAEGLPVAGTFSVMRPPPAPTRGNSRVVADPVLTAKIQRARALLGRDVVSDEDLFALQRAGKLDDLAVARRL